MAVKIVPAEEEKPVVVEKEEPIVEQDVKAEAPVKKSHHKKKTTP